MFQVKNLKYKNILNIDHLSIPQGKVTCIIGESGSGKTTLLRLLNKMISPDGGSIHFNNAPLQEMDSVELRRRVVMLPQTPAIFPGTVKDNLLVGLEFSEKPLVLDGILNQTLEMVSLKKELDQKADKLSGGEKQRLALGRVLLLEPEVFLLDEPSSALDENTEELIIKKLVDYCTAENKSLIMVTHSKRIANTFGEHIIEIKNGEIVK